MKEKDEERALDLEIERSRLNREKSILLLNKSLLIYFSFLFVAIVGFVTGNINRFLLNVLVIMGFGVLFIGTIPYVRTMKTEEKKLDSILAKIYHKK